MPALLSIKGIVLAGLMQAQKLILAGGGLGGIDPLFRIMTPEGDYLVSMPIAEDPAEHRHQLQLLSMFMALKHTHVFTVAGQLVDPEAVYCFGASEERQAAVMAPMERGPARFGSVEWLQPDQIEEEILNLLPPGTQAPPGSVLPELDAYFGPHGKFPAIRLGGGPH
jgi:hypothetical protein